MQLLSTSQDIQDGLTTFIAFPVGASSLATSIIIQDGSRQDMTHELESLDRFPWMKSSSDLISDLHAFLKFVE